jgi:hypothetical protein
MSTVRHVDASAGSATPGGRRHVRRFRDRWIYPAIGVLVALVKAHAFGLLSRHRLAFAPAAAVWLLVALVRVRLAAVALSAGVLAAAADSGGPLGLALLLGLATFALLMAGFLGVATVLQLRQPEWRPRPLLVRTER